MAQQTAVEWLVQQTKKQEWFTIEQEKFIEQAKQMEKEQIAEAYRTGVEEDVYNNPLKTGEQYYNETYGKAKSS